MFKIIFKSIKILKKYVLDDSNYSTISEATFYTNEATKILGSETILSVFNLLLYWDYKVWMKPIRSIHLFDKYMLNGSMCNMGNKFLKTANEITEWNKLTL